MRIENTFIFAVMIVAAIVALINAPWNNPQWSCYDQWRVPGGIAYTLSRISDLWIGC